MVALEVQPRQDLVVLPIAVEGEVLLVAEEHDVSLYNITNDEVHIIDLLPHLSDMFNHLIPESIFVI
jgi:hypothetical protein